MTREFSPQVEEIAEGLIVEAGNGLYSVIREAGVTCPVCATPPSSGYVLCQACERQAHSGSLLADRVGSLVYALEGDTQLYKIVQNYKAPAYSETSLPRLMSAMLALGLRTHYTCARALSGEDATGWAVVPSTKGRTKLRELVLSIGAPAEQEVPISFSGDASVRTLRPGVWAVDDPGALPGHVVVVDDSWVTGSNAQGIASMLKHVGVKQVSIFTVARVMRPDYPPSAEFIASRLELERFDWRRCPWTGGDCPA